jgi:ACR3 family arsenite efflux pump ArsB
MLAAVALVFTLLLMALLEAKVVQVEAVTAAVHPLVKQVLLALQIPVVAAVAEKILALAAQAAPAS